MIKKLSIFILIIGFLQLSNANTKIIYGDSAWVYGFKSSWISIIKDSANKKSKNSFRYLFVNVGKTTINQRDHTLNIEYNKEIIHKYHQSLPNVKVLSNLSFWVGKTNFLAWDKDEYIKAADKIAKVINDDKNSSGVFLDLEIYDPCLIPFYKEISYRLSKENKIMSFIVRPENANRALFNSIGKNSIAVLYGYDLHDKNDGSMPVSPEIYKQRLAKAVVNFKSKAEQENISYMIGIPAIATEYEWQTRIINKDQKIENKFTQYQYLTKAIEVTSKIRSKNYIGRSVWAFVADTKDQEYWPLEISQKELDVLGFTIHRTCSK